MSEILRRSLLALCSFLLLQQCHHHRPLVVAAATSTGTSSGKEPKLVCKVVEACRRCTDGDRDSIPECKPTGKILIRRCTAAADDETASASSSDQRGTGLTYVSCPRTKSEEEFLLVRLQVFWLLLGLVAFWSVRKQQIQTSSLFDQRKRRLSEGHGLTSHHASSAADNNNNNDMMDDGSTTQHDVDHVELASMSSLSTFASKEEMTPLTARIPSNLEII